MNLERRLEQLEATVTVAGCAECARMSQGATMRYPGDPEPSRVCVECGREHEVKVITWPE